MREREDANRTREAGNRDEVEGVVANTLDLFRGGAVGFIDWLGLWQVSRPLVRLCGVLHKRVERDEKVSHVGGEKENVC